MEAILSGLGLSTSAGLNAYLPLILMNLAAQAGIIDTKGVPAEVLTSKPALVVFLILLVIETVADKIPAVDSVNDIINTAIRPTAGALMMVVSTSGMSGQVDPEVLTIMSLLAGGASAGSVHAVKATARPAVTLSTAGMGNMVVSVLEDILAIFISLVALLIPFFVVFFMASFVGFILWWIWERQRKDMLRQRGLA
ncbi:MAG: hypothetical protein BroJett018_32240 [Chloroflexota bacterium]|nr:DUF4126 domain-containing protein [Chloroflexota bacterium]NOG66004.1 DUF4126 domain-containing protein [Chloroflexota bacterium]GIK65430.1 MAG: hypothetical protein BroJett018_32240 [Chloroflexota bacterium]